MTEQKKSIGCGTAISLYAIIIASAFAGTAYLRHRNNIDRSKSICIGSISVKINQFGDISQQETYKYTDDNGDGSIDNIFICEDREVNGIYLLKDQKLTREEHYDRFPQLFHEADEKYKMHLTYRQEKE